MSLKGTKTKENLEAAFAGESQANRRYLYLHKKQISKDTTMLRQYLGQRPKVKRATLMGILSI